MAIFALSDFEAETGEKIKQRAIWPYGEMDVGDAVLASTTPNPPRAATYAHVYARQAGKKFGTRLLSGGDVLIFRKS